MEAKEYYHIIKIERRTGNYTVCEHFRSLDHAMECLRKKAENDPVNLYRLVKDVVIANPVITVITVTMKLLFDE